MSAHTRNLVLFVLTATVGVTGCDGDDGDDGGSAGESGASTSTTSGTTTATTTATTTSGTTTSTTGTTTDGSTSGMGSTGGGSTGAAGLEISGMYTDDFATAHVIDELVWTQTFGMDPPLIFNVSQFDNDLDSLVAQNDAGNPFSPNLWSKFEWTMSGGELWVCQVVFDAPDEATAAAAGPADATDPSADGCGGFPWSRLTPR